MSEQDAAKHVPVQGSLTDAELDAYEASYSGPYIGRLVIWELRRLQYLRQKQVVDGPKPMTPEDESAHRFLNRLRKRYAKETSSLLVCRVPIEDLSADAKDLVIRYLMEASDANLGLDVMAYPGPPTPSWAIQEAVKEEREACAKLAEFMGSPAYTIESGGGHGAPADGAEIGAAIRCGNRAPPIPSDPWKPA